ncbi:hypothetical protein F2Q70_00038297 [Brassica cretica]|uniref:Uncharacterized protein n=1 Tax=Brassica cretica TaxID=69181 RepID=A0A3N6RXZ8_BRACR|nr:hypothetical protein F2Q70_00038297 [Brassica cretica]
MDKLKYGHRITHTARSLRSDQAPAKLGRYVATEHAHGSVATYQPSTNTAWSLRSDRAPAKLGRYVATELSQNVDTTRIHAFSSSL